MSNCPDLSTTQIELKTTYELPSVLAKEAIRRLKGYHKALLHKRTLTKDFYLKTFGEDRVKEMTTAKWFYDNDVVLVVEALNLQEYEIKKLVNYQNELQRAA